MRNILSVTSFAFLFIATAVSAQKNSKPKWKYSGLVNAGVVGGSSTVTYTVQTVQGIQKNNWFMGIGAGYDDYGMPGIPLVLHGQKAFTQMRAKPFVYAQTGIQFPVKKGQWDEKAWNGQSFYSLSNGFIGELGAGYLVGLGKSKKTAVFFSTGYSYKFCKADYYMYGWNDFPPYGDLFYSTEKQSYHYRRIAVKVGFQF
jgi:fluoride ion exporter CrcB/FEX